MRFEQSLKQGYAKKVKVNNTRANDLMESSKQAINTALKIPLSKETSKTIIRELYEGLREFCEALGYKRGYKFLSHETITYFLSDVLDHKKISEKFDRFRRLRNGINYYGNQISLESVKEALDEIPKIIKHLEDFSEE